MSVLSDWISLRNAPPPAVAVEIAAQRVSAASLEMRGGRPVVAAHAVEPLPDGRARARRSRPPISHDRTAVVAALGRVLERVGRPRRIGLIVPDPIAKVSLVRFEKVPARAQDLDQLIRWQVRKAAPVRHRGGAGELRAGPPRRRRPGVRRDAGAARRRPGIRRSLCGGWRARGPRRHLHVQRRSTPCSRGIAAAAGRLAAGQRRVRLRLDRHSARPRSDFLSQPRRRQRRDARRSGASDGDVLRGSAAGRGVRPRHAVRRVDRQRRRRGDRLEPPAAARDRRRNRGPAGRRPRWPTASPRRRRCSTRSPRSSGCSSAGREAAA